MVSYKTQFLLVYPENSENDKSYRCAIKRLGTDQYGAFDINLDLLIENFDTDDIVCLMFESYLERICRITGKTTLKVQALNDNVIFEGGPL